MSINVQKFQTKTETEMKNYDVIKSVLSKLYDAENDLNKKRKEAFEDIKKINEENDDLKSIYINFSEKMKKLEDSKNDQIMKIKTKLIPTTEAYVTEAKKTKQEIGNYKNIKSKTESQEEEMKKSKQKGDTLKSSQISLNISQNKSAMKSIGKSIEEKIMTYEYERLSNNKLIMLHLINYEMAYHAQAIEQLTKLFKEVKEINPKKSLKQSVRTLNLSKKTEDEIEESDEENEDNNEEDDDGDDDNIKESHLTKSKNTKILGSNKKSQAIEDEKESESEVEK